MTLERTILVAEDDPNDVFLLERAFSKTGERVRVHFVEDGQQAIHYLAGEADFADRRLFPLPDLLITDLKMPRANGFEVVKWVRSQAALKEMLVVVLTASGEPEDVRRAYEVGANSYLVKPTNHQAMLTLAQLVHDYWMKANHSSSGLAARLVT